MVCVMVSYDLFTKKVGNFLFVGNFSNSNTIIWGDFVPLSVYLLNLPKCIYLNCYFCIQNLCMSCYTSDLISTKVLGAVR